MAKLSCALETKHLDLSLISSLVDVTLRCGSKWWSWCRRSGGDGVGVSGGAGVGVGGGGVGVGGVGVGGVGVGGVGVGGVV